MEPRSSKREQRGQAHEPSSNRKSERHRLSETEKRASADPRRRSTQHELPKESLKPALSGDDDYVRRWLAQTDKEIDSHVNKARTQEKKAEHLDIKQRPQLDLRSFRHAIHDSDNVQQQQQSKGKRRHRSSSDSSLLEPVAKPEPKSRKGDEPKLHPEKREDHVAQQHKKHKVASSDSESSAESNTRQETFEKRDRHKTREDRYELKKKKKKKHKSDKPDGERKPKKKREKKGDKKRASKKAGEDLMNNFSSKSVAQDRLTIRPSHAPGLFKNGRASSPARRRGLPDLVFSEMEFLQHPQRHPEVKTTSKSYEKDKRRASREQDKISRFFKPTKTPLSETSPNAKQERSSTYMSDERSTYIKQRVLDRTQEPPQNINLPEKPYLGFGHPDPSSDRFSASRARTPSMHRPRTALDTTSRLSENTTTGVTWSETQISPGAMAASRSRSHGYQRHASPTPVLIRRSIQNTGIFRGSGMEGTPGLTSSRTKLTPPQDGLYEKQFLADAQDTPEDSNRTTESTTPQSGLASRNSEPSANIPQSESRVQTPRPLHSLENDKGTAIGEPTRGLNELRAIIREDPATVPHGRIIIDHYDPSLGWHQQQDLGRLERTSAAPAMDVESLRESKSTPLSREQIAKNARVKRPATTLPVTRLPREPNLQGVNTDEPSQQAVSEENTKNSHLVTTAPTEHTSQPPSVRGSETAAAGQYLSQASLERPGNEIRSSYSINNDQSLREFSCNFTPPPFTRLVGGASREGAAIPISRNDTPMLGSARPEITSITGPPIRGISRFSFEYPAYPRRQPEPLYLNQIQRQFPYEEPVFENDNDNDQPEEHLGTLNPQIAPYLEAIDQDMLDEQDYEYHCYAEYAVEGHEEFGYVTADDTNAPQMWQPVSQGDDTMEHHEAWDGPEYDMGNDYEVVDDGYDGRAFAGTYGMEEHGIMREDQMAEEVPMLAFWRPNRPY